MPDPAKNLTQFPNGCVVEADCADTSIAEPVWSYTITAGPNGAMPPGYVANDPRWPGATIQ